MSTFKDYLAESYKEYHYRIKTVTPLDDDKMDAIEIILQKYDVVDVTSPRQTPIQENPLEFYDIHNTTVYIVDAVTRMPASTYVLQQEFKEVLDIPENYIVVRADNDPIEVQTQEMLDKDGKAYEVKLSTEEEYNTDEQITEEPAYGDEFNQKFLSRVARARYAVDTEVKDEKAAFNDGHDGVKPHYGKPSKDEVDGVAPTGNFDDDAKLKNGVR